MDRQAAAALQLTEKRARQAFGAIRKATRLLAQTAGGYDSAGVCEVRCEQDIQEAKELVALAFSQHGQVDVVLLIGTATDTPPHGPTNGAKELAHDPGN